MVHVRSILASRSVFISRKMLKFASDSVNSFVRRITTCFFLVYGRARALSRTPHIVFKNNICLFFILFYLFLLNLVTMRAPAVFWRVFLFYLFYFIHFFFYVNVHVFARGYIWAPLDRMRSRGSVIGRSIWWCLEARHVVSPFYPAWCETKNTFVWDIKAEFSE